jgi:diaminohydroxyphosphoribosylaminopyrimidine deaminase/5-amino-6-(5-phosphoribosylamino)uracil reductase
VTYMHQALALARQALGATSPNPAVGAVLVKDDRIVGQGFTQPPGGSHAEVVALAQAGENARGSTLYVTLEPCCHHGRTNPCTQAIIDAGVERVQMSMLDPNPRVSGGGRRQLEESGVEVVEGDGAYQAHQINEWFFKYIRSGLPFVTAKFAASLDGKIATASGESYWISSVEARLYTHNLRGQSDVVMVGVNTILADDPLLNARDKNGLPGLKQPLRLVVDSSLRTPLKSRLLQESGPIMIATASPSPEKLSAMQNCGVEVLSLPGSDGKVDLRRLLNVLGQRELSSVLAEGGGSLLGSLFDLKLIDKVLAFIAPMIIGGAGAISPVGGLGVNHLADALKLSDLQVERIGEDLMITGYCDNPYRE